jgi:hypothetical protein
MADLSPIFRGIKNESRLMTASGNYCATLASKLEDHFRKTEVLQIEGRKLKGGIDLLACLPSILSKVRWYQYPIICMGAYKANKAAVP